MKALVFSTVLMLAIIMFLQTDLFAQGCVQCRMGPSSNLEGGGNVARGINSGLLYLILIPYLLIMSIVGYVFRKQLSERWNIIKNHFGHKAIQN